MTPLLQEMVTVLVHGMHVLGWWGLLSIVIGLSVGYAIGSVNGGAHGDD